MLRRVQIRGAGGAIDPEGSAATLSKVVCMLTARCVIVPLANWCAVYIGNHFPSS
jgi:hypothetical protein